MRPSSLSLLVPAALALVVILPDQASAFCRHGRHYCGACGSAVYGGYGAPGYPAGAAPGGTVGTPPAGAPLAAPRSALPYPGASANFAAAPAAAPMARPVFGAMSAPGAYSTSYTYSSPGYSYSGYSQSPLASPTTSSYLDGYSNAAPIQPIQDGMMMADGHQFGSFIFNKLAQFGRGQNRDALRNIAAGVFRDAVGFMPGNFEAGVIEQIVSRFLGGNDSNNGGAGAGNGGSGTGNIVVAQEGGDVLQFVVTVRISPVTRGAGKQTTQKPPPGDQTGQPGATGDFIAPSRDQEASDFTAPR